MKLARLGEIGHEVPVALVGDRVLDIRPVTGDIDAGFLASGGAARVQAALGELQPLAGADGLRVGSPIARPGSVVCIGMNYAAHAAESGSQPPSQIVVFLKPGNTVVGPNDDVEIPPGSVKTDWEVELGIVIGAPASYLTSRDEARAAIAGYVVADDVSEREYQLERSGGQWSKGKSSPGFTPVGPWFVSADEVDPAGLRLRSWVNGEPRQDSTTADLIFDVEEIVLQLSQYMLLEPGDLILSGTPEGVALSGRFPYLRDGDIVETEIAGLGRQRQRFVAHRGRAAE
jgi:2,4-didehydro-3-deoxy-L-rhamnonate hydrolase